MKTRICLCIVLLFLTFIYSCQRDSKKDQAKEPSMQSDSTYIRSKQVADTLSVINPTIDSDTLTYKELTLSGLSYDMSQDTVIQFLERPDSTSNEILSGATGTYSEKWYYVNKGLILDLHSDESKGLKRVRSILAKKPCTLRTKQGISIGDHADHVFKAYAHHINSEYTDSSSSIVIGSIYDGLVFKITDQHVEQIFIGAAAE